METLIEIGPDAVSQAREPFWGYNDIGCHIDYVHGWDYVRSRLADFVERVAETNSDFEVVQALRGESSDDVWEEDEAIEILNRYCEKGCFFEFNGEAGAVLLAAEENDEECE